MNVVVIGAGLAGCEAAYQLTRFNIPVTVIDMKPVNRSLAHHNPDFAELVCSNSLKSTKLHNASGLLKEEMRIVGSLCMEAAKQAQIPAGGALAVDRQQFSAYITQKIQSNKNIKVLCETVSKIPIADGVIIATGPLTQGELADDIKNFLQVEHLSFYDAASPIITADSIDENLVFRQNRYEKESEDYVNCPMDRKQYQAFHQAIINAQKAPLKNFEELRLFEGCIPIEILAERGEDTMRFGPLKPVGLTNPKTGYEPYACVQLRKENNPPTLYSLVGFQTRLTFSEQKRVFRMIPGLQSAEFIRFGVMHRNTFIHSPGNISKIYQSIKRPSLFFAGQITGVEGYVESMASGMIAGINAALYLKGIHQKFDPDANTMMGALAEYIGKAKTSDFQPMNANFGIINPLEESIKNKSLKYSLMASRAIKEITRKFFEIKIYMDKTNS
jgi:methylenetetrahydrofolate--tRNA-(uracil-5-)-methyltransferase